MYRILPSAWLLVLLLGCGGGGNLPPAFLPNPINLGTIPANAPTAFALPVTNPYDVPASVLVVSSTPGLTVTNVLPAVVPPAGTVDLDVLFSPGAAGPVGATIRLRVESGAQSSVQQTVVSAIAEAATASLGATTLDFGSVAPGASTERTVVFTNTSAVSTVAISSASASDAAFALIEPALPRVVQPGASVTLRVRHAPSGLDAAVATLTLATDASNGPLQLALRATGTSTEEIITFEDVAFEFDGDTPELTFAVPGDAIAFLIEGTTATGTELGLRLLTGPGNKEYENEALRGPYIWSIQPQIFTAQVPNTDRTDVQLVPGGGTYRFKLLRWSGSAQTVDIRVIIERRPDPATRTLATLDLNVFLASGIAPTAATASEDATLQTVLSTVGSILGQQGIQLGDVAYYDVNDSRYDDVTWSEFGDLLELSSAAADVRLNLFFVRTAIGGGVLGVSATLGGPALNGTPYSGVMSRYSTNNPAFIGLVAAHEIGHFLGLAHTVEQAGTHDDITDTLECPATGTNQLCSTTGGGYLMHWQAVGGTQVTDGQGLVVRGHPHMSARDAGLLLQAKPAPPRTIEAPAGVSPDWCATCRTLHAPQLK